MSIMYSFIAHYAIAFNVGLNSYNKIRLKLWITPKRKLYQVYLRTKVLYCLQYNNCRTTIMNTQKT